MYHANQVWLKVLKPFCYHAEGEHPIGEAIPSSIREANKLIKSGHAELCVNNNGDNLPYDEPEFDPFVEPVVESVSAPKHLSSEEFDKLMAPDTYKDNSNEF